jgi:hypothetical protein
MVAARRSYKSVLVSFATSNFQENQNAIAESAVRVGGISRVDLWSPERLRKTEFYREHSSLLDQKRGAGYWVWKPYIILQALINAEDEEFIVYWDSRPDCLFRQNCRPLLQWAEENNNGILPGTYLPFWGPNKLWTKRDAFVYMDCDAPVFWDHCQVQAGFSVWQKSPLAISFVQKWLDYCLDPRIVSDAPNVCGLPNNCGFMDHRHDQSVLTNLVIKEGVKTFGRVSEYFAVSPEESADINFIISWIAEPRFRRLTRIPWGIAKYATMKMANRCKHLVKAMLRSVVKRYV